MRSCYRKYGRLALKYHDIILGHFYGHYNMDHFFFIDSKDVRRRRLFENSENDNEVINDDKDIYDDDDDGDDNDDDDDEYEYEDEDDYDEVEEDDEDGDDSDDESELLKIGSQEEQTSQNNTQDEIDDGDGKVETNVYNINKYMIRLLKHYRRLSRSKKEYAVIHINPSIIPTFFPALRIFKYNITEVTNDEIDITKKRHSKAPSHENTFL